METNKNTEPQLALEQGKTLNPEASIEQAELSRADKFKRVVQNLGLLAVSPLINRVTEAIEIGNVHREIRNEYLESKKYTPLFSYDTTESTSLSSLKNSLNRKKQLKKSAQEVKSAKKLAK